MSIQLKGLPNKNVTVHHYRVDKEFSNSYEAWKAMGSPKNPTPDQVTQLEKAGQLKELSAPKPVAVKGGEATLNFSLPRQGVSLLKLTWE